MAQDTTKIKTPAELAAENPQPVPAYGSEVKDASGKVAGLAAFDPNTGSPLLPRVAPNTPPAPIPSPYTPAPATDFGSAGKTSEQANTDAGNKTLYEQLLAESKNSSDIINKTYEDQLNTKRAAAAGIAAASGLGGSSAASAAEFSSEQPIYNARQQALLDQRTTDINNSINIIKQNNDTLSTAQSTDTALKASAKADAMDAIKTMATAHVDLNKFKTDNPQEYQHLTDLLGGSNYVDAAFANSIPKEQVLNTTISGSTAMVISQDPVTGKTSAHSYDLGISVPKTWTMEKIGTNSVIYHEPNWDPTDPSTYQIFAIDPLTGLPTTQVAGNENPVVTQEKQTVTDLSGAISNVESGGSYTAVGPVLTSGIYKGQQALGKYQIVPGAWFDTLGLDPTSEADKQAFLGDTAKQDEAFATIMGGLIRKNGGDQAKAIAEYFGGTPGAKAYGTPAGDKITDGNKSINQYVKDVMAGVTPSTVESQSITQQAGISLQVFNYLTQGVSSMSRLAPVQRNQIMNQANEFLNKHGLDVSTFQSQYKTYNDVLSANITRQNKTQIMEKELLGTAQNLKSVVNDKELGNVNLENVAKVWAGEQVNDNLATQYAFHFQQLKNELAGYFAASQGKNSPDVIDNQDAANAVKDGMATGSLDGFISSIKNSTGKMKSVLDSTVDETRKSIWDLFGVGDKYQNKSIASAKVGDVGTLDSGMAVTKADDGKWYDSTGKSYDDNGNPL